MDRLVCISAAVLATSLYCVELLADSNNYVRTWVEMPVAEDPLARMPGTQPAGVQNMPMFELDNPDECYGCHGLGFNKYSEPGFNWSGSMVGQSARDPLFWSSLAVAAHDSIWAINRPNAADMCVRCHLPKGWLEGRSDPVSGSRFQDYDHDGVQCDTCHKMFDPSFEATADGTREGSDWEGYWDEALDSWTGAYIQFDPSNGEPWVPADFPADPDHGGAATLEMDRQLSRQILLFNGGHFYSSKTNLPRFKKYVENGGGQFFVDWENTDDRRGPFNDAVPEDHDPQYSRYHKSKFFCSTCHDVSNPTLANLKFGHATLDDPKSPVLPTERLPAFMYFDSERTFSEFRLSDWGKSVGGAPGLGPFAPNQFKTSRPGNYIAACQDCHMRDIVGTAAEDEFGKIRPVDSEVHPNSGQPLHDFTGGGAWMTYLLASALPESPAFDQVNSRLLFDRADELTLDLKAGTLATEEGRELAANALIAGSDRAKQELRKAAAIKNLKVKGKKISFKVQNYTGHKLITGYPEGRRMFLNIRVWDKHGKKFEINPYDYRAGTLKGLKAEYKDPGEKKRLPEPAPLSRHERYMDRLVYEIKKSSSLTGEKESFHFALLTDSFKDNRIPPKGFEIKKAALRKAQPYWEGKARPDLFTRAEYKHGYDAVEVKVPIRPAKVEVVLYYQTTSREYIEFLRDEINDQGNLPSSPTNPDWDGYIVQKDPFFEKLRAWGKTIWRLWKHNKDVDGAKPLLMTSATWPYEMATLPAPTGLVASLSSVPQADDRLSFTVTETAQDNPQWFCYTITAVTSYGQDEDNREEHGEIMSEPATSKDMCVGVPADPNEGEVNIHLSWDRVDDAEAYLVQYYQGFVSVDSTDELRAAHDSGHSGNHGAKPFFGDAKLQWIATVEDW